VYLENRVGALAEICGVIAEQSINLLGLCAIDTVEEAVLRMVPADEALARRALEAHPGGMSVMSVMRRAERQHPG
jgi:hypothetical protein